VNTPAKTPFSAGAPKAKIIHVLECGDLSGCSRLVSRIANALDKNIFDVYVVYALRPGCTFEQFASLFGPQIRLIYLPLMRRHPSPCRDFGALLALRRILCAAKPDAVHLHSSKAGFLGRLAAVAAGVPRIYYSSHGYSFRMRDASLVSRAFYWLLEFMISKVGTIIVNSPNELKSAALLAWPRQAIPCSNAVHVSNFSPAYKEPSQTIEIMACGRVTCAKNPAAFIRLAETALAKNPCLRFTWIGSGDEAEREEFLRRSASLPSDRFALTGWLDSESVKQRVAQADIFVHYSLWDACPIVVTEAMALGKPVVGSRAVDQIREGENGFIVKTEVQLLEKVLLLASDAKLRTEMSRASRRIAEQDYDFGPYIQKLSSLYLGRTAAASGQQ